MTVTFKDTSGNTLRMWDVRAGMRIVSTEYSHSYRTMVCVVDRPALDKTQSKGPA